MSAKFPTAKLTDIAELNPTLGKKLPAEELVSFVPMASLSAESASVETTQDRPYAEVAKGFTPFLDGDVLVAKITPCFENGKIAQARLQRSHGFGSTEFHVVRARPGIAESRYLHHYLRLEEVRANGQRRMTGSGGQRRVPASFLADLAIPLPPLEEQRRIAAILDQAETLRTQRRTALALLDSLTQSLFLDMFGDLATNPQSFQTKSLCEVATFYGGNSLPSGLEFTNQVGGYFLMKVSDMNLPGNEREILQCQSWSDVAGSKASTCPVGSIVVPKRGGAIGTNKKRITTRPTVLDPNLMAICPNPDQLNQEFLFQWFLGFDLASIASGSSVPQLNKQDLAPLTMLVPPLPLQQTFATRIASIEALKATHRRALAALDALFASLQQRAFAGQL